MDYARLGLFRKMREPEGLIGPAEVAQANARWDAEALKLPDWIVPVPPEFIRDLPDRELTPIIVRWHAILRERELAKNTPITL